MAILPYRSKTLGLDLYQLQEPYPLYYNKET
jgi:hypothetical protein